MRDPMNTERPFRILSLDGGGVRGLYTATFLKTLLQRFAPGKDLDIGKGFDLIAGTSTGAILACAFAKGIQIDKIIDLYKTKGPTIFNSSYKGSSDCGAVDGSWKKRLFNWCANKGVATKAPTRNPEVLKSALTEILGDTTLQEMYSAREIGLCVPAICVEKSAPWVFKTGHVKTKQRDNNYKLVDICMSTSAAMPYFPPYAVKCPDSEVTYTFVDGGFFQNSPILISLIEGLEILRERKENRKIELYSFTTGGVAEFSSISKMEHQGGSWIIEAKGLKTAIHSAEIGARYSARFLADIFTNLGQEVRIFTPEQFSLCETDVNYFTKMDSITNEAIAKYEQLGGLHANEYHSGILRDANLAQCFQDLIKGMPSQN